MLSYVVEESTEIIINLLSLTVKEVNIINHIFEPLKLKIPRFDYFYIVYTF